MARKPTERRIPESDDVDTAAAQALAIYLASVEKTGTAEGIQVSEAIRAVVERVLVKQATMMKPLRSVRQRAVLSADARSLSHCSSVSAKAMGARTTARRFHEYDRR